MSGGFSVTISALETCQQAVSGQAGHFGDTAESFSAGTSSGSEFGTLPSVSGQLSSLTSRFNALGGNQFSAAKTFLTATANAVGTARENYIKADATAAKAARNIVTR
jgi:hypothetical protein